MPSPTTLETDTLSASIDPSSISHIIVSHAHWVHIHPIPAAFSSANMIVGPGSTAHCKSFYPTDPRSKYDGRIWDEKVREFDLRELPGPKEDEEFWQPLGPFERTHDFFGDGSFYIIEARGHMVGNLAALLRVRTTASPDSSSSANERQKWKYVLLGGDCAYCNLFTYWPDTPFGKMPKDLFPSGSLHECVGEARDVIKRIAECKRIEGDGVLVWYAHGDFLEGVWEVV